MTSRFIVKNLFSVLKKNATETNFKRTFSLYPAHFNESNKFEESDWFNKLTDTSTSSSTLHSGYKIIKNKLKFQEMSSEEKKKMIESLISFRQENGLAAPKKVDEKAMELLLRSESYTHLTKTIL